MVLVGLWHGANWTFVAWGAYHGFLLIGYRLFDRATVGTAIDKVIKKRWFVPFSVGAMFCSLRSKRGFFRPKTLQTSAYVLGALFGSLHITGEFLLTTGTLLDKFLRKVKPIRLRLISPILRITAQVLRSSDGRDAWQSGA